MTGGGASDANPLRGFDLTVAAIGLAALSSGFWRLWPGAAAMEVPPIGALALQAGFAALGLIALAARWESALAAVLRNPVPLVFLVFALAAAGWAVEPAGSLQSAIMLALVWLFGMGLAARLDSADLAETAAVAAGLTLLAHLALHAGRPPASVMDAEAGFAVAAFAWAAAAAPGRARLWLAGLAAAMALGFAAGDASVLGAVCGAALGWAVHAAARRGQLGLIGLGWLIVALIAVATAGLIALDARGGASLEGWLSSGEGAAFGPGRELLGMGLGGPDISVARALSGGLGLVGLLLAVCAAASIGLVALTRTLRGNRAQEGLFLAWCACIGALAAAPQQAAMAGPLVVMLSAVGFCAALSPAPARRRLVERALRRPASASRPARGPLPASELRLEPVGGTSASAAADRRPLTAPKGLRPRI